MDAPAVVCTVVVDCRNPAVVAAFWQAMLGGRTIDYPEMGVVALRAPGVTFDFVRNEDEKQTKNRWHLDLATEDPDATVERALGMGAARAEDIGRSEHFFVMRDPEGNEFCILRGAPAGRPWAPPPGAKP